MAGENGQNVRLSLPRKWVTDLMYFSRRVPLVAGERVLHIKTAYDARKASGLAVGWNTMIVKAMAILSMRIPEMRRAYLSLPWPRLYEAPYSVGSVILNREFDGEHAAFIAPVLHPEQLTLLELQRKLDKLRSAPLEEVGQYRRLIRITKLPRLLRRFLWATGLYVSGLFRARNFGTYAVNSVAAFHGKMLATRIPITSCLYYYSVSRDGDMMVQLAFDHNVFDGYTCGRVLSGLEQVLNNEIATELAGMVSTRRLAA